MCFRVLLRPPTLVHLKVLLARVQLLRRGVLLLTDRLRPSTLLFLRWRVALMRAADLHVHLLRRRLRMFLLRPAALCLLRCSLGKFLTPLTAGLSRVLMRLSRPHTLLSLRVLALRTASLHAHLLRVLLRVRVFLRPTTSSFGRAFLLGLATLHMYVHLLELRVFLLTFRLFACVCLSLRSPPLSEALFEAAHREKEREEEAR